MPFDAPLPGERDELIRAPLVVLGQSCGRPKGGHRDERGAWCFSSRGGEPLTDVFESGYISAHATGILALARLGLVEITEDHGQQVVGELTQAGRDFEAGY